MSQGHVDSLANGVYEFYFEDLRPPAVNDWDFEDVVLRVEEAVPAPGQLTVTFVREGAGYWFNLIDNSGNVIMANMDDGSAAPSPRTPTGTSEVIDGTFASYGMNRSWVETKNPQGEMIFIMDYVTTAAWGGHLGYYDTWANWIDIQGKHRFARHAGSANVVFMDGAVQQYDTAVIDPVLEINRLRYWLPQDAENPEFPN
jgi:prepilin-type processing-associated H-X9-DG protein